MPQIMNIDNDDNDTEHLLDGVTEIDTHDDEAFSIALYAQLLDNSENEANHNEWNTKDAQTQTDDVLPCKSYCTKMSEKLSHTLLTSSKSQDTSSMSFFEKAEFHLQDHFDQILSDEPLLDESLHGGCFKVPNNHEIEQAHDKQYTLPWKTLMNHIETLVQTTIESYKEYFKAEHDIMQAAKRFDNLETWIKHTKTIFDKDASLSLSINQQENMLTQVDAYLDSTNDCKKQLHDALQKWSTMILHRKILQAMHEHVGGTTGCKICFNKQVNKVFVPCGHVICTECAEQVINCPFCQSSFYAKQNIFFM